MGRNSRQSALKRNLHLNKRWFATENTNEGLTFCNQKYLLLRDFEVLLTFPKVTLRQAIKAWLLALGQHHRASHKEGGK